jgi:hypothetical protein
MNSLDLQERVLSAVAAGARTFGQIIARVAQDCTAPISGMAEAVLVLVGQGRLAVDREGRLSPVDVPENPAA